MALVSFGALAWLSVSVSGCAGDGAAVSVRWRVVDLSSGGLYDPREQGGPNGSCRCVARDVEGTGGSCAATYGWSVPAVRLVVENPSTRVELMRDSPELVFPCAAREATTPFILPIGTVGLSLRGHDPDNPDTDAVLALLSPPPVVRELRRAQKVGLDVVEIGVNPP
jgi:hypothetical protein